MLNDDRPGKTAHGTRVDPRWLGVGVLVVGSFALLPSLPPIPQDPTYHAFADSRVVFGIPNGLDVLSNLPFLLVGLAGLSFRLRAPRVTFLPWRIFFLGVLLVSIGSAYYHWLPGDGRLVFDRLPMTLGFMGLFVALLAEHLPPRLIAPVLWLAVALGVWSVVYWHWTDDLRPYYWVQAIPFLILPLVLVLFDGRSGEPRWLWTAFALYLLAKITEHFDRAIFQLADGWVSGHTLKHLLAAGGCYCILRMLDGVGPPEAGARAAERARQ